MFYNPVRVHFASDGLSDLPGLLRGRSATLITTPGMKTRGVVESVQRACAPQRLFVYADVQPNPTIAAITIAAEAILDSEYPELLIALGGGSTIDTAKGVAAIASAGKSSKDWLSTHLRKKTPFPDDFAPPAIIAIPTTAGTGSEVTMWGTVWDEADGSKHSISHPLLFPEAALLIPELTATSPPDLTLFSALDTISHCMESIWNRGATAISDVFAVAGLKRSFSVLDGVLEKPADLGGRCTLQEAALLGGFAISSNATALAHSMSYPFTSRFGMPHGLACSFTLPEVMFARFGYENMAGFQPMKSLLAAGVPLALGSDGPPSPFLNILFAVTHPTSRREALTREQAVSAYTRGSAFAEFAETAKGTLAPGMLADLAVLSQDIFTVEEGRLPETSSALTIIGGRVVYDAPVTPPERSTR